MAYNYPVKLVVGVFKDGKLAQDFLHMARVVDIPLNHMDKFKVLMEKVEKVANRELPPGYKYSYDLPINQNVRIVA